MIKLIQIDDAGSGSLIGGTVIAMHLPLKNKFFYGVVPPSYYNMNNFKNKLYMDYVIEIIKNGFEELNITREHNKIQVCPGYTFDKLRVWLTNNGYSWENMQITGRLQTYVENQFNKYALSLGFPKKNILYTKYPFHFHRLLRWVYADYENRYSLCKTGWNSWQKYSDIPIHGSYVEMPEKNYTCLKCGKRLRAGTIVKKLEYTSNKNNIIYLHYDC